MERKKEEKEEMLVVQYGDLVTLYSHDENDIMELQIGEVYFKALEDECIGKVVNDVITLDGAYTIQYIDKRKVEYDPPLKIKKAAKSKTILDNPKKQEELYIYVYYRLSNTCVRDNHDVTSVTLECVDMRTGKNLKVNAFYCKRCSRYFINYEAINTWMKDDIFPSLNYYIPSGELHLKPFSKLRSYGYTVAKGTISDHERQGLLKSIIDRGLMTKEELIKDIEFKISYNGSKKNNKEALEKWKSDVLFISKYVNTNQKKIHGKLIRNK